MYEFRDDYTIEFKDGRLCGTYTTEIIVWNTDSSAIEMTVKGHTNTNHRVIQLRDDRVCSCSYDRMTKLLSTDSELCELTLTGHTLLLQ